MQFSFVAYAGDSLATAFEKRISRIFNADQSFSLDRSIYPLDSASLHLMCWQIDQNEILNDIIHF